MLFPKALVPWSSPNCTITKKYVTMVARIWNKCTVMYWCPIAIYQESYKDHDSFETTCNSRSIFCCIGKNILKCLHDIWKWRFEMMVQWLIHSLWRLPLCANVEKVLPYRHDEWYIHIKKAKNCNTSWIAGNSIDEDCYLKG